MNQKIMSYIPKGKIEAIRDAYKDEDGYWICLNEGWEASRTDSGCHTIHEDTIKELRYQIAGIQRVVSKEPDPELKKIQDSMTESFYEFCTGEPIPEDWHEIVEEEKAKQAPKSLPAPSRITPPAPTESSPSAAEAVGFGICMALAYTAWIAREAAELLILALQVAYVTLLPIVLEASERLWRAWLRIYPTIVPTARRTARIAAKQAAMAVWWLWIVIA